MRRYVGVGIGFGSEKYRIEIFKIENFYCKCLVISFVISKEC